MSCPRRAAIRLSFFYAAFFAFVGISLPFWPVWLRSRGLDAYDISIVLAVSIGAKVFANPIVAHLADRSGHRRTPMLVLSLFSLAAFAAFAAGHGFWAILWISVVFFSLWPPIMALGESLTMLSARSMGIDYGRTRMWGSAGFIVCAVAAGQSLEGRSADLVFWMLLAAVAMVVAANALLPDVRAEPQGRGRPMPVLEVLRRPLFARILLATAAVQGSHAVYYAFGTLHWQAAGYGDGTIGMLWAEGVIAEIILFAVGDRLVRRIDPLRLLAAAGLAGALRWALVATTSDLGILIVAQALHAFTFGAAHLSAIHLITRTVEPTLSATAQSLYSGAVMGLGMGLALWASGPLFATFGGGAYFAMSGMAAAGGILAYRLGSSVDDHGLKPG